jgi:hypothetical protein
MTNLTRLLYLLEHINSFESCSEILSEAHKLSEGHHGWFFRKLHTIILSLIDHPDTFYGVSEALPSPVLQEISIAAQRGIAAIELSDEEELNDAAKCLANAIDE